ncbi:hypothetical protein Poly41_13550 [Novipirellula artificiosorum]|uniref:Uncharacterized protein n=1 Tax=Novipirellula artificiosorum TaxID=2528016 RepID=A0A5C6DV94_9BACT|nr:hypothetical protein Poly41_13550 [Novipirellula artificiosorum]
MKVWFGFCYQHIFHQPLHSTSRIGRCDRPLGTLPYRSLFWVVTTSKVSVRKKFLQKSSNHLTWMLATIESGLSLTEIDGRANEFASRFGLVVGTTPLKHGKAPLPPSGARLARPVRIRF